MSSCIFLAVASLCCSQNFLQLFVSDWISRLYSLEAAAAGLGAFSIRALAKYSWSN